MDPVTPAWKGLVLIEQLRCKFTQKLKHTPGAWDHRSARLAYQNLGDNATVTGQLNISWRV